MFERHFDAYGVRIGLHVDCRALLDALESSAGIDLPYGWRAVNDHELGVPVAIRYHLRTGQAASSAPSYRVYADTDLVVEVRGLADAGRALAAHAEPFVAQHAPDHLFVHAGVVGWQDRAIVMPGASFAGKTTMVQAWLEAGATYYSDEFAVLDTAGRVHPFARPLSVRDGSTMWSRRVPAGSLGAQCGTTSLPIGLVLVTSYRAGACWRPRRLTTARTLIELMRHAIAARGDPAHSMPILNRAVSESTALAGLRGEARPLVAAVLQLLDTPTSPTAPKTRRDSHVPTTVVHHAHGAPGRRSIGL